MADIPVDGMTRVAWVLSISNKAAPTVAELTAGILLTEQLTEDGIPGFEAATARIPNTSLASKTDTTRVGRRSYGEPMLRIKKQTTGDTPFTTLIYGALGFVVIRRYIAQATAWTAGQMVNVYPAECGETRELPPEGNTMARYEVPIAVHEEPELRAVIA